MARKAYWTIVSPHGGSFVRGLVYWKEGTQWFADPESAHHFRTAKTAEKKLPTIEEMKPDARVVKVNPNNA